MVTYKVHLFRHGLTHANMENRYIGKTDPPLCQSGISGLKELLETREYPEVSRVYSSPLRRALQTAELLFPNREIVAVDKLRELDFGEFENRTIEDLENDPAFQEWISSPGSAAPGGESGREAIVRATEGLAAIFAEMMEKRILSAAVVTHAGIISGLLASLGLPEREAVRWNCHPGEGYTLLLTPQMWMRDHKFEVYNHIPWPLYTEDPDEEAYWQELESDLDEDGL